jgi:hypothetical protein
MEVEKKTAGEAGGRRPGKARTVRGRRYSRAACGFMRASRFAPHPGGRHRAVSESEKPSQRGSRFLHENRR